MSSNEAALKATIARIWRGRTTRDRADEYETYLYAEGIRPLEEKALGVQLLREDRSGESEFVTISYWESIEAMSTIHRRGPDPDPPPGPRCRVPGRTARGGPGVEDRRRQRGHLVAGALALHAPPEAGADRDRSVLLGQRRIVGHGPREVAVRVQDLENGGLGEPWRSAPNFVGDPA